MQGFELGTTTVLTTLGASYISSIAQGDDAGQREGSKILVKMIMLNYVIYAGDASGNNVRVTLISDKQPNGAAFVEADVWQQVGKPVSQRFFFSKQRYTFIYDKVHSVSIDRPTVVRIKIPQNKFIYYGNATTGVISNCVKNALWLTYESDSPVAPSPTIEASVQMLYIP